MAAVKIVFRAEMILAAAMIIVVTARTISMGAKIISVILVSIGLGICTIEDGRHATGMAPSAATKPLGVLQTLVPPTNATAPSMGSAIHCAVDCALGDRTQNGLLLVAS